MEQTETAQQVAPPPGTGTLRKAKKPVIIGGVVAGVLYLASLLPGLGLGLGKGAGSGKGDGKAVIVPEKKEPAETPVEKKPVTPDPSPTLYVVVDKYDYQLREFVQGKEQYRKVSLDEILEMAQNVPGDERSIRVWIAKTPEAKASALHKLQRGLWQASSDGGAGLRADEVQVKQDPVLTLEFE